MNQYLIIPKEEYTTKTISLFADEYHENQWEDFIFTQNNEVIAILSKNEFRVKEDTI